MNFNSSKVRYKPFIRWKLCSTQRNFNSSKVRYKRNKRIVNDCTKHKFQFLQGTVQTSIQKFFDTPITYFNSSKVRYKPGHVFFQKQPHKVFQFLQGTVQTRRLAVSHSWIRYISIPPRYGTNFFYYHSSLTNGFYFNSSKVRYKPMNLGRDSVSETSISIPPRYGTNTRTAIIFLSPNGISIPPRYGTNHHKAERTSDHKRISIPPRYGTNQGGVACFL